MKKNQAREFACKVKQKYNQYLPFAFKYGLTITNLTLSIYYQHPDPRFYRGLLNLGLAVTSLPYIDKDSFVIYPNIDNCWLFLQYYKDLQCNLYDTEWINGLKRLINSN